METGFEDLGRRWRWLERRYRSPVRPMARYAHWVRHYGLTPFRTRGGAFLLLDRNDGGRGRGDVSWTSHCREVMQRRHKTGPSGFRAMKLWVSGSVGLLLLLVCGSGCGLLTVPYLQPIAPEPLRRIVVVDAKTQEPLDGGSVTVRVHPWENWIEPLPIWGVGDPDASPLQSRIDQRVFVSEARKLGPGVFETPREAKWAAVTIWFPIPSPLGWVLYHSYASQVVVAAPGHQTVWVSSTMTRNTAGNPFPRDKTPADARIEFTSGQLQVFLPESSKE